MTHARDRFARARASLIEWPVRACAREWAQGASDNFLTGDVDQLQPSALREACAGTGGAVSVDLRMREGYDHSYFFISSFIEEHINYHADALGA